MIPPLPPPLSRIMTFNRKCTRALTFGNFCRHEHTPDHGHVVSVESMLDDILLMKDFNFNCVRCSHYPNDEIFYQV